MSDTPAPLPEPTAYITDSEQREAVIRYIRDMTKELSVLAERAQCPPLSDCLRKAYQKASNL
ncbi:hypothetical protein [Asticcacaulis sp.]|uniref:hypothetical protein n=1 Tax=Asticcacaulis sp. TaxID=1872648 RepID=UPI00261C2917|nr:hypothetical protein [Asticcacaulis sp.]